MQTSLPIIWSAFSGSLCSAAHSRASDIAKPWQAV
jgi:hypothetical protein